jgi:hypothetical protein
MLLEFARCGGLIRVPAAGIALSECGAITKASTLFSRDSLAQQVTDAHNKSGVESHEYMVAVPNHFALSHTAERYRSTFVR